MNRCLEKHKRPKLTQEERENLNKPVSKEIGSVIKKLSTKSQELDDFTGNYTKY